MVAKGQNWLNFQRDKLGADLLNVCFPRLPYCFEEFVDIGVYTLCLKHLLTTHSDMSIPRGGCRKSGELWKRRSCDCSRSI